MKKVFLGGTANGSDWRSELVKKLKIDYFDPIVKDWDEKAQKEEIKQRKNCDYCLYVITPKMDGVYSIAEVIDDSNKRPDKTIFAYLLKDDDKLLRCHTANVFDYFIKKYDWIPLTIWCMRRFACRNFQFSTESYSKLSYTPCYMQCGFNL